LLELSKQFKNDVISPEQTLIPVVIITDNEDNVLHSLSTHRLKLNDIVTLPIIKKVSKVKINTDYDQKKLKINTFRCDLYNYVDYKDKFAELNDIILNKIYLFYKSPSTNNINFSSELTDYDCAMIFSGVITRLESNEESIAILGEDSTQQKIANKQIPHTTIDKLPDNIQDRVLRRYKNNDKLTVPMVFGKVDKSPTLPYIDPNDDRTMNVMLDIHPTTATHKTAKLPSMFTSDLPMNNIYYLYIKNENDYLIWDHFETTANLQAYPYSRVTVGNRFGDNVNYLLPEIQEELQSGINLWDIQGLSVRLVENVGAGTGSVLDLANLQVNEVLDHNFTNIEKINDNAGYRKIWYRDTDPIINATTDYVNALDTGVINYNSSDHNVGEGRWFLLKMERGTTNVLKNLYVNGQYIGNTFVASNWNITTGDNASNNSTLPSTSTGTGFFIAPLVASVWKDKIKPRLEDIGSSQTNNAWRDVLNWLLIQRSEDLQEDPDDVTNDYAPNNDPYKHTPLLLEDTNTEDYQSKYFGGGGSSDENLFWKKVQGLYYGDSGADDRVLLEPANSFDYMLMFEFYPKDLRHSGSSYKQKLKMDNIGFLQSVHIPDVRNEEIFASVTGRHSFYYTEEIHDSSLEELLYAQNNAIQLWLGVDGEYPDFETIYEQFEATLKEIHYNNGVVNVYPTENDIHSAWENNFIEISDDSAVYLNYVTFRNIVYLGWKKIFDMWHRLYTMETGMGQILENDPDLKYQCFRPMFEGNFLEVYFKMIYSSLYDLRYENDQMEWGMGKNASDWDFTTEFINPNWLIVEETEAYGHNADQYDDDIFGHIITSEDITTDTFNCDPFFQFGGIPFLGVYDQLMSGQFNLLAYLLGYSPIGSFQVGNLINDYDYLGAVRHIVDQMVYGFNASIYTSIRNIVGWSEWSEPTGETEYLGAGVWADILETVYAPPLHSFITDNRSLFGWLHNNESDEHIDLYDSSLAAVWSQQIMGLESFTLQTDGIIDKPADIVINLLTFELGYGRVHEAQDILTTFNVYPDYTKFDTKSIEESRSAHSNFKMGFAINEKIDSLKLLEEFLQETKSYPKFTGTGKFGLITINEKYTEDDIDRVINEDHILRYKMSKTKVEDIITSCKMFYRYDNGNDNYPMASDKINIEDLIYDYNGYEYYGLEQNVDGYKEFELRYHTENETVEEFQKYKLLNECNVHNIIDLTLPLNYIDIMVGDKIHIPLINNERIYGMDYSKVSYLNGQAIYPLWLVMSTDISEKEIKIKAYQLHYLGVDGDHGYGSDYDIVGNMNQYHSSLLSGNGSPLPNWNYNALANVHNDLEIAYGDITADGIINVVDIIRVVNHIVGIEYLTASEQDRINNINLNTGELTNNDYDAINVVDAVALVSYVLGD
tara:strand:- start:18174 stop:22346 length:4173 start_codon:yes stop_codon:yes gene_type:complete